MYYVTYRSMHALCIDSYRWQTFVCKHSPCCFPALILYIDIELCLRRLKPEETLTHSVSDVQTDRRTLESGIGAKD